VSSTATPETRRRLALAAAVTGLDALIVSVAAVLVPQDAGWRLASLGWAALLAGPFLAAQCVRRHVPSDLRGRWAPIVTLSGWAALALVWLLSKAPALVTGPPALLLAASLLAGPFCGAWLASRPRITASARPSSSARA
jgi:hypothetical protein